MRVKSPRMTVKQKPTDDRCLNPGRVRGDRPLGEEPCLDKPIAADQAFR